MKKLLLTSILMATVVMVLGGMNAFQSMEVSNIASKNNSKLYGNPMNLVKYDDCIVEEDFPLGYLMFTHEITNVHDHWDIMKVNESVQKYSKSLDSTLKNLSTVDAHEFIHQAFMQSKNAVEDDNTSDILKHYHGEIMRICYARDKHLNQNTIGGIL